MVHTACKYWPEDQLEEIIGIGVDLNAIPTKIKMAPIHFASKYSTPKIIKLLIDKNVNLEEKTNESLSPIHHICKYSTKEVLQHIVEKKVDLECRTTAGWKPIHLLSANSDYQTIHYFIGLGIELNDIIVYRKNFENIISLLMSNKNLSDPEKESLIYYLVEKKIKLFDAIKIFSNYSK